METAIQYLVPDGWLKYDQSQVFNELTEAKARVIALQSIPYQRRWVEELQKIQLKMEVAGTSQIEGANFAGNELDQAIRAETAAELFTRSQRQASAAVKAYRWIAKMPDGYPMNEDLVCEIHSRIVTDCDEDHCAPGKIRSYAQNVTFGVPLHRGVTGGPECEAMFARLGEAVLTTFPNHDPLIQALALHYHFASMHPFADGNGRTARALEAFMLRKAGLKDTLFIAMSNYYHEEKREYLDTLAAVRSSNHDLTSFLKFGLRGIALQSQRLSTMIRHEVSKQIFRNLMLDLFNRLESTRKRVIVRRQLSLLERLLDADEKLEFLTLVEGMKSEYKAKKEPVFAVARDINRLLELGAIKIESLPEGKRLRHMISVNLDWPMKITETEFFAKLEQLPKSKTYGFLSALGS